MLCFIKCVRTKMKSALFLSLVISWGAAISSFRLKSMGRVTSNLFMNSQLDSLVSRESLMAGKEEKFGWERLKAALEEADKDPKKKRGPPIYEPESYQYHIVSALAYLIPIVDASDLGKYMFEAYPAIGEVYNTLFGGLSAVFNGVPFLPFAVFFLMSYICRAPSFPVEVRFHFAQAFMISLVQFVPSLGFGLLEKAGVPGMAVLYNTGFIKFIILFRKNIKFFKFLTAVFLWVIVSSLSMQILLLNPLSASKNPLVVNVVGWAMRYMNYTPDMIPKGK